MEQRDLLSAGQSGLSVDEVVRRLAAQGPPGRRAAPQGTDRPPAERAAGQPPDWPGRPRGDHDLNPDLYDPELPLRRAAVLVPLVERADGLTVLLTRRTDHLFVHAGQIAFPGGSLDPGDADAAAAALRETEEEIGLPRAHIRLIGQLDTYVTRTGFEVEPKVGLVTPPFPLALDSFEVAEVFEVPLGFILAPASRQTLSRMFQGRERHFYAFPYGDYFIWGATAGMLVNLAEVLAGP
jgi:8-oxo-dGTP pyrophosphatase MutT (NUDIX family)